MPKIEKSALVGALRVEVLPLFFNIYTMNNFKEIDPYQLEGNIFNQLHHQTMLITAGNTTKFNTMTASWGGFGIMWNKPVAFIMVRPQRYTREFIDANTHFSLSFFGDEQREALHICGKLSGRDENKVEQAGLSSLVLPSGTIAFEEAELIFECKKVYKQSLAKEGFIETSLISNYPIDDYHIQYIGIIENVYTK